MRTQPLVHGSLSVLVVLAALLSSGHGVAHQHQQPDQVLWSTYWTVQPGFTSTLEMKNNRVDQQLTAWVSLYFTNGEENYLEPIQLGPRQTVVVNLNQVYESLPAPVRARVGKEGAVEVSFRAPSASSLMGGVSIVNPERGIAWNFRLYGRAAALPLAPLVGAFWFYDSQSDGFVAMQNVSEETIHVTPRLYVNGAVHTLAPFRLWSDQVYKLELGKELRNLGLTGVRAGGIELAYEGPSEALVAHGALFNGRGFSSEITFLRRASGTGEHSFSVRTPRVAIGSADPRLGLPAPTSFEPLLALANFGDNSLPVQLTVGFQAEEGKPGGGIACCPRRQRGPGCSLGRRASRRLATGNALGQPRGELRQPRSPTGGGGDEHQPGRPAQPWRGAEPRRGQRRRRLVLAGGWRLHHPSRHPKC